MFMSGGGEGRTTDRNVGAREERIVHVEVDFFITSLDPVRHQK